MADDIYGLARGWMGDYAQGKIEAIIEFCKPLNFQGTIDWSTNSFPWG